ncbi:hypothetical protein F7725_021885, partial [Dissostichus mawsoni]
MHKKALRTEQPETQLSALLCTLESHTANTPTLPLLLLVCVREVMEVGESAAAASAAGIGSLRQTPGARSLRAWPNDTLLGRQGRVLPRPTWNIAPPPPKNNKNPTFLFEDGA